MPRPIPKPYRILPLLLLEACTANQTDDRARIIGARLCSIASGKEVAGRPFSGSRNETSVSPSLNDALAASSPAFTQGCSIAVQRGDGPSPYGDGKASHWLSLRAHDKAVLHVRLRYDQAQDRFDILGFWSVR